MSGQYRIVLLVLGGLFLLGLGGWLLAGSLRARHHFRTAQTALDRFDFDEAREHISLSLKSREDAAAYLLAAQAARRAGDLKDAELHLKACGRFPDVSRHEFLRERTLLHAQQGGLADVEAPLLARVREEGPDAALVLEALAQAYASVARPNEAMACLDDLIRRQPDHHQALAARARLWVDFKKWDKAAADFRRSWDLRPGADVTRLGLAEVLERLGWPLEAMAHYEDLHRRQPARVEVVLGLARCRQDLAELDAAELLLEAFLLEQPRSPGVLAERGRVALRRGQTGRAEECFRQVTDLTPRDADAWRLLGLSLEAQGKADEARACSARRTELELHAGRVERLTAQVAGAPHDPVPRYHLGKLLLEGGAEEGVRWLESALEVDPRYSSARQLLTDYYRRTGQQPPGWEGR
jgi:predicted Zn-dependent protease